MAIVWPTGLPLPIVSQQVSWPNPSLVTSVQKGPIIVERWTEDQVYMFSVRWNMSSFEWRLMQGFIYHKLLNGTEWFDIPLNIFHSTSGETKICEANFMGDQPQTQQIGGRQSITAILTIRNISALRGT